MNENTDSEIILRLLEEITKDVGFLTSLSLFERKTGIAILLYHGSRYFNLPAIERVADVLIDDIIEESEQMYSLGLYILSRYATSRDKNYWNCQANIYCNQVYRLMQTSEKENIFDNHKFSLTPLHYCLREWEGYNFPFLIQNANIRQLQQHLRDTDLKGTNTIKNAFAKKFFYEPVLSDEHTELKEIPTITDINTLFFNKFRKSQ